MHLTAIHHARFKVADLDKTERFATDFGLTAAQRTGNTLYMRTAGGDAYSYVAQAAGASGFVGFAFEARGLDDLREAVAEHGASPMRDLDGPGGGKAVTLTDPNGFAVDIVTGIERIAPAARIPALQTNTPQTRVRYGQGQNFRCLGPAHLYRLGHIGLFVKSFRDSAAWYGRTLGLIGSDVYHTGNPEQQIVGFFRLNRGAEWVDHHVLALLQAPRSDCHHISFEAQDFEAQFTAHRYLESKGYESIWGVGRHPHGSHVFDVWRDPDRYRFETFSDTDLLNADQPTRIHDIHTVQMDIWSSDPPDRYFA